MQDYNSTLQIINRYKPAIGPATVKQLQDLYERAYAEKLLHLVQQPDRIIKVGDRIKGGLRVLPDPHLKELWDSEPFVDPLLRRYQLIPINTFQVMMKENLFCCFHFPEFHTAELEQNMMRNKNCEEAIKYRDYRLVAGYKIPNLSFPIQEDMNKERERIIIKEKSCYSSVEKYEEYFINPSLYDRYLFSSPKFNSHLVSLLANASTNLVIYIGNGEYRLVRTKIEQWMWEQYVKIAIPKQPELLNELLYTFVENKPYLTDYDRYTVKIYIPYTNYPRDLNAFIYKNLRYTINNYNMFYF